MFTFFKELFWMVKMLFSKVSSDQLSYRTMKYFPFKGYRMMWCGHVLSRDNSTMDSYEKNHEKIHLYQANDYGYWIVYYLMYILEYLGGFIVSGHRFGYYMSKYEIEAYKNMYNLTYLNTRQFRSFNNYDLSVKAKFKLSNQISVDDFYKNIG